MPRKSIVRDSSRFGIGEWYGKSFVRLTSENRRRYAHIQSLKKGERPPQPCPPRGCLEKNVLCTKEGGVCSIRLFTMSAGSNQVSVAHKNLGNLRTTCPYRFQQNGTIFSWIGEEILGHTKPLIASEVGFLEREPMEIEDADMYVSPENVGRIDNVLVHPDRTPLAWCALEIQAVYFSGASMTAEFKMLKDYSLPSLPFPAGNRRPDYRSSGPKRLMPQLQIKVPSLRRWGKKMAVIVDRDFFDALGTMDEVQHVSNCDVAWFVVKYDETGGEAILTPDFVRLTTLERAVEGLTGGIPVSLETFESRIREKLTLHTDGT